MALERIGTPTGWVLATPDASRVAQDWGAAFGLAELPEGPDDLGGLTQAETAQVLTIVEFAEPDPPVAMAVRVDEMERAVTAAERIGLQKYWRDSSPEGTVFVMCRADPGLFVLLYQRRS